MSAFAILALMLSDPADELVSSNESVDIDELNWDNFALPRKRKNRPNYLQQKYMDTLIFGSSKSQTHL